MRIDQAVLDDITKRVATTEESIHNLKEEFSNLTVFHKTLKMLYKTESNKSGYDKTVQALRKKRAKLNTDYEELLTYYKNLKVKRRYVAKKLAAMKKSKGET